MDNSLIVYIYTFSSIKNPIKQKNLELEELRTWQPDISVCNHHMIITNGTLTLKIQGSYVRGFTVF